MDNINPKSLMEHINFTIEIFTEVDQKPIQEILQSYYRVVHLPALFQILAVLAGELLSRNSGIGEIGGALLYIVVIAGFPISLLTSAYLVFIGLKLLFQGRIETTQIFKFLLAILLSAAPLILVVGIFAYLKYGPPFQGFPPLR